MFQMSFHENVFSIARATHVVFLGLNVQCGVSRDLHAEGTGGQAYFSEGLVLSVIGLDKV